MGLDRDFLALLTHQAVLYRYVGEDQWGNNTYAVALPFQCFVLDETEVPPPPDSSDRQRTSRQYRYSLIADAIDLKVNDRVVLDSLTLTIKSVETYRDEDEELAQQITAETQEEA